MCKPSNPQVGDFWFCEEHGARKVIKKPDPRVTQASSTPETDAKANEFIDLAFHSPIPKPESISWDSHQSNLHAVTNRFRGYVMKEREKSKDLERQRDEARQILQQLLEAAETCKEHCYSDGTVHHKSFDTIKIGAAILAARNVLTATKGK